MSKWKRVILAIIILLIALAAAWGIYWLFFKPLAQPPFVEPVAPTNTGQLPPIGPAGLLPVTPTTTPRLPIIPNDGVGPYLATASPVADSVKGASLSSDGSGLQYYDAGRKQFVKMGADGKIIPLSSNKFYGISQITWSARGDKAILQYPDGKNILFDFNKQQQSTLPSQMRDFSFDTNGQKLSALYVGASPEEQWLVTSDPDGNNIQLLEPIAGAIDKFQVSWSPSGQAVALFHETVDGERQQVIPVGREGENFKSFIAPGRGFVGQWSGAGEKLLYSVYNTQSLDRPQLYLTDGRLNSFGSSGQALGLMTSADRCNFSGATVFCSAYDNPPALISHYPELGYGQPQSVWRIDLNTGTRVRLGALPGGMDGQRVFTSADGQNVYIEDAVTGRLYVLPGNP